MHASHAIGLLLHKSHVPWYLYVGHCWEPCNVMQKRKNIEIPRGADCMMGNRQFGATWRIELHDPCAATMLL